MLLMNCIEEDLELFPWTSLALERLMGNHMKQHFRNSGGQSIQETTERINLIWGILVNWFYFKNAENLADNVYVVRVKLVSLKFVPNSQWSLNLVVI